MPEAEVWADAAHAVCAGAEVGVEAEEAVEAVEAVEAEG